MALLPNTYVYGTQGSSSPTEKIGGVAIGITDATNVTTGQPLTVAKTVRDMALPHERNTPKKKTTTGTYNVTHALANTGNFYYDSSDWIVKRMGTTINGTASTLLLNTGTPYTRPRRSLRLKGWGAKTSSAFRANQFKWVGGLNQRTPWTVAPSGQNATFKETTSSSDADDQAIYVTWMAVPGELVYMDGERHPFTDEYAARTLG